MSISELLKSIPNPQIGWFEKLSLQFLKNGNYDNFARCLIACCVYGESSDADSYLFDIDDTIDYYFGYPEQFTTKELTYCEPILIPKLISMFSLTLKEPCDP
jgi:hypothetical protein